MLPVAFTAPMLDCLMCRWARRCRLLSVQGAGNSRGLPAKATDALCAARENLRGIEVQTSMNTLHPLKMVEQALKI